MRTHKNEGARSNRQGPPYLAESILGWLIKDDWQTPLGDFEEYFNELKTEQGLFHARWWYRLQVLKMLPDRLIQKTYWTSITLKNNAKTAFRNISRQKGYAFLNIAGLTLGLACCILIFQFVAYQRSFDKFNEHKNDVYRVAFSLSINKDDAKVSGRLSHGMAPAFGIESPEIKQSARIFSDYFQEGPTVSYRTPEDIRTFKQSRVFYADPEFLDIFTYPLLKGDRATALRQPKTILLTESTAQKYFGKEDPIGKTLEYRSINFASGIYTVAGILRDFPSNSHIQADMLLPMQDLLSLYGDNLQQFSWDPNGEFISYVKIRSDARVHELASKLTDILYRNLGEDIDTMNAEAEILLQPLKSIYLDNTTNAGRIQTGHKTSVDFFLVIAIITLVIALINYTNLATARAIDRAKEVGVRKTIGAKRGQLIGQFMVESALTNLIAFVFALFIATLLLPVLNKLANTQITLFESWTNGSFVLLFAGVYGLGVFLSGLYPSFVLSSFKPASVLKGRALMLNRRANLRKGLVILQFAASISLLIGTGVVYAQLQFMRNMDIGLDVEQVLIVTSPRALPEGMDGPTAETTLKNKLLELAQVRSASFAGNMVGQGFNVGTLALLSGSDPSAVKPSRVTGIDHTFVELYGLELIAGEPFVEGMAPWFEGPFDEPRPVLINETAVNVLGLPDANTALGKVIKTEGLRYRIRGVLKDFNWSSAHQPSEAIFFRYLPVNRFLSLKIAQTDITAALITINQIYDELFPNDLFQYQFADAVYNAQYQTDERFVRIFSIFAGLAIFIACLGLFGLASFTALRRKKEIGIRKALGASPGQIVKLLTSEFLLLVVIALFLSVPLALYFTTEWLARFAYRIDLPVWILAGTGLLAILIAFCTIGFQAIRAASANPINSLRYE